MYFSFQNEIDDDLWDAISKNYESENYQSAILDAIFFFGKTIREKTNLDLDGVALTGKAFGGNNPLLKVNPFLTESEKSEQKGIESLIRGIFQGIRNPRAHEKVEDNKENCDSFIVFINYLYKLVKKSKTEFDLNDFLERIFDKDFVESEEYADLLFAEIPQSKIFDVLLEIIEQRSKTNPNTFYYIITAFLKNLDSEQYKQFIGICSDILKKTNDDTDIRLFSNAFQNERWEKIELSARLRIENKLIKSFEEGYFDSKKNRIKSGALGTWIVNIIDCLKMKKQFKYILSRKISSDNYEEIEYIFRYFRNHIIGYGIKPERSIINAIKKGLEKGDKRFYDLIAPEFIFGEEEWTESIKSEFDNFKEKDLYPYSLDDDIPF